MDLIQETLGQLDTILNQLLANPYVSAALTMFIVLYAGLAAPTLPAPVAGLFDFTVVKIFVLALILFVNNYNSTVALVSAVAFFITLQTLSRYKVGGLAEHVSKLRQLALGNDSDAKVQVDEENQGAEGSENIEAVAIGTGPGYGDGSADFAGETQVSGLASRTQYYEGPQGMKHPVGFNGFQTGAQIQY